MASVILRVFLMLLMRSLKSRVFPSMTIVDPLVEDLEATFVGEKACTLERSKMQHTATAENEAVIT